jgi:glycosyltransferase involved in cell wall biosynthesis
LKLLFVTPFYTSTPEHGGIPTVVSGLARGLVDAGHAVTVLTDDAGSRSISKGAARPIEVVVLPELLRYRSSALSWGWARFCRQRLRSFDAVHIWGSYHPLGATIAAACRRAGVPYVFEPSGALPITGRGIVRKYLYQRFIGDRVLTGASVVVGIGEAEKNDLVALGADPSGVMVRRNGVDTRAFAETAARGILRFEFGIPSQSPVVLFVGRLNPIKGLDILLDAFSGIGAGAHLVLVGPSDDRRYFAQLELQRETLRLQSRVHFAGPRHGRSLREALADADVFVLPSRRECFGVAAAEAVAAGVPVVVTCKAGIASLVEGRAGLPVTPEPLAIATAIRTLLEDASLLARLRAGCAEVVPHLSWDEPVAVMDGVYRRLGEIAP